MNYSLYYINIILNNSTTGAHLNAKGVAVQLNHLSNLQSLTYTLNIPKSEYVFPSCTYPITNRSNCKTDPKSQFINSIDRNPNPAQIKPAYRMSATTFNGE